MKRFFAVLAGLLVMPAFAEVAPVYYEEVVEYSDDFMDDNAIVEEAEGTAEPVVIPVAAPAAVSPRVTAARATSRTTATASTTTPATTSTVSRGTTGRVVSTRGTASRNTGTNNTASRVTTQSNNQSVSARRTTTGNSTNVARAAATSSGSLVQTDTVNSPLYTGRVGVRTNSASYRAPSVTRIATATTTSVSDTSVSDSPTMDEIAQMTDFCKAQYTQCMDNFCNILDDNQGRCSCSANLKNYSKTEDALKQATEELQDVAQKIQYIGLTKDEVITLFNQTEAELAMQNNTDTTRLKNDLDKIKNLIIDVKSGTATTGDSGMSLDLSGLLDFSFSSNGFDLNSLFGNTTNTNSISNQRGADLYKTAAARCKGAVLDSCKSQGVDITIITNGYDLEIDKQCIVYERSLSDANTQMTQTVRNAKSVLQKARLLVAQQKNSYDLRGCVNALDSCMQDDFVCGSDYENCLDPTGKYIVNGDIVTGGKPGVSGGGLTDTSTSATGLYATWNYSVGTNNAWGNGTVGKFIDDSIGKSAPVDNMIVFLQNKIGYNDGEKNHGMCMSVLNKCQDHSYTGSGNNRKYSATNNVIREFFARTLMTIKTKQDEILASYSESCISDVSSCLSTNNYGTSPTTAVNACKSVITTCVSVTGSSEDAIVTTAAGYTCPSYSTLDLTKSATETGTASTKGVVNSSPGGRYCTCIYNGIVTNGVCPAS